MASCSSMSIVLTSRVGSRSSSLGGSGVGVRCSDRVRSSGRGVGGVYSSRGTYLDLDGCGALSLVTQSCRLVGGINGAWLSAEDIVLARELVSLLLPLYRLLELYLSFLSGVGLGSGAVLVSDAVVEALRPLELPEASLIDLVGRPVDRICCPPKSCGK